MLSVVIVATSVTPTYGQTTQADELREIILAQDKGLFDAFNACDIEKWKSYLAEGIEFYQDNDAVTTTRDELEPFFKDRCGINNVQTLRRELLPETVEVHSIQGYGAVQFGMHRFWIVAKGQSDQLAATPKFVHLWQVQDGAWQITRVISYGH
jgi:hypothetical protein